MNMEQNTRLEKYGLIKPQELSEQDYRFFTMVADMKNADKSYASDGHILAPMYYRQNGMTNLEKLNLKAWFAKDNYQRLLTKNYAFLPHEPIDRALDDLVNYKLTNMELYKTYDAHKGHTKHWTIISKDKFSVDGSDTVQIGCAVRNGIGTGVSLGIDLFSFRGICSNGAVLRSKTHGTLSMSHVGDPERLKKMFAEGIDTVIESVKNLLRYYRKATKIAIDSKLADQIYRQTQLADVYLPDWWNVKHKDLKNSSLSILVDRTHSLWETFNAVTAAQRERLDKNEISFTGVSEAQNKLHKALIQIVDQKGGI